MGFSSIPSLNVGPGGTWNDVGQAQNALTKSNLDNNRQQIESQILKSQAPYAPYQAYATAAKTMQEAQWMPYQRAMQMLPMMLMGAQNNPELQNKIMNMMNPMNQNMGNSSNGMPSMPGGMPNMPLPDQGNQNNQGNGIAGMLQNSPIGQFLGNIFGGKQQNQNPISNNVPSSGQQNNASMSPPNIGQNNNQNIVSPSSMASSNQSQNGSPLVPATKGGMAGYVGHVTAPYQQSIVKPGGLIPDPDHPGHVIQAPTSKIYSAIDNQLLGLERVDPQLQRLGEEWGPFMDVKGMSDLTRGRIGSSFASLISPDTLKKMGLSPNAELSSQYAKAQSTTKTAPEALVKAYGLNATDQTLHDLREAIVPIWGENQQTYTKRILQTIKELHDEQASVSRKAISHGVSSYNGSENNSQSVQTQQNQTPNIETTNYVSANQKPVSMGIGFVKPNSSVQPKNDGEGIEEINLGKEGQAKIQDSKIIKGENLIKINNKWYHTNG